MAPPAVAHPAANRGVARRRSAKASAALARVLATNRAWTAEVNRHACVLDIGPVAMRSAAAAVDASPSRARPSPRRTERSGDDPRQWALPDP